MMVASTSSRTENRKGRCANVSIILADIAHLESEINSLDAET